MGNAIKNYEKKKRRKQKEAQREIRRIVHDMMMTNFGLSHDFKQKEQEIFDLVNNKH